MTSVKNSTDARYAALAIRKKLGEVASMVASDPSLVRVAVGDGGDKIVFWYANGAEIHHNVSAAERKLAEITKAYPDALKSRSGKLFELPI